MRADTLSAVVVLVVVLGAAALTGAVTAASGPAAASNETEYTLGELQQGGTQTAGAPPSTRWLPEGGTAYLDYQTPGAFSADSPEWAVDNLVNPGSTIKPAGDELTLHVERGRDAPTKTYELVIVYWQPGQADGTAQVARQTVETKEITLSGPFSHQDVTLQQSPKDGQQVTMWLRDANGQTVEGARWRFEHQSAATSQAVPFSTMGGLYKWLGLHIILPSILGLIAVSVGVPAAIRRAGAGPSMGWPFWVMSMGVVSFLALAIAYTQITSLLVAVPYTIAVAVVAITGVVLLETYEDSVREWAFMRLDTERATNPVGKQAADAIRGSLTRLRITYDEDGRPIVLAPGLSAFVARLLGGTTLLEGADRITSELDLIESDEEKLVFVDDDPEHAIEHRPEGLTLTVPDVSARPNLWAGGVLGLISVVAIGQAWFGSWVIGLALAGPLAALACVRPVDGYARVVPAPGQARAAYTTAMYLDAELDAYETVEELASELLDERSRSENVREWIEDIQDRSVVTQSHHGGQSELFRTDVRPDREVPADD